ncbi:MAG: hypothetical protein WCL00_06620, partial [Bacteroidota bacterium]
MFDISLFNENGLSGDLRFSSLMGGQLLEMYYVQTGNQIFQQTGWHHFAFVCGDPQQRALFYFDGSLLGAYSNSSNITYINNTFNVYHYLKTKPLVMGGCNAGLPAASRDYSFITGMDEIRIWNRYLPKNELVANIHKPILQESSLVGYWNFDDLRNRLNFISDLSYNNNDGQLKNNAAFFPEYPEMYAINDTLTLTSSNAATDSVQFAFLDQTGQVVDSVKIKTQNHSARYIYDISTLSYTVSRLRVREIFPGCTNNGFTTYYNLKIFAPQPLATPQTNWGVYYNSGGYGTLENPILLTGLPANTTKVVLGLRNGNNSCDVDSDTINSVPYQYSLALNGIDNYIKTSNLIQSPDSYEIDLWFKTTTTAGGQLIGFCDSPTGVPVSMADRELIMEKDGSIRFTYLSYGKLITLYGANKYNDGFWHCVSVQILLPSYADLLIDNSLVDQARLGASELYNGYWVIGRNDGKNLENRNNLAPYFKGSLAYINIYSWSKKNTRTRDKSLLNGAVRGTTVYMLNEGIGTVIHDIQGSNPATLMGSTQNWTKTNKVSALIWQHDMQNKNPGIYTFYATVFYPGANPGGVTYSLGTFTIANPVPGYDFRFNLANGTGYFNEGEALYNPFYFMTNYTGQGQSGWQNNFVRYYLLTSDHQIIDQNIFTWTGTGMEGAMTIDMGGAPPGSYLNIQVGYQTSSNVYNVNSSFSIPILIRPMLAPTITGDFGPFTQAIAPGTMAQSNTFTITEPGLSDLTTITGTFSDRNGNTIATAQGIKVNDTTWSITQNMAVLAPPETYLNVTYFLGANQFPALVAGPYKIIIRKTRPAWFDVISDTCFSNIQESGDNVTFQVTTPFGNNFVINNSVGMDVPSWVPLIGSSNCQMLTPTAQASLKYIKSQSQLVLNQPPQFFQKYFDLGAGNPETIHFNFNESQNNSYSLDANNDLIASQNFSAGGSLTSGFTKFTSIVQRIQNLIRIAQVADPETIIVSPSFSLTYTGSFEYASRLHLMVDTNTGKWGSFGNLSVDANPAHTQAYQNSASYHFYSGALGMEFSVGAQLLDGLASGNFGLDGRFVLGFGHSYTDIPNYQDKLLKSFAFQTYGRFYISILWGWYEKTVWGPTMFYSTTIWGDDMSKVFPSLGKAGLSHRAIHANSSRPELGDEIRPLSSFSQVPMPSPQSTLKVTDHRILFNWLEQGKKSGERNLRGRTLDLSTLRFSKRHTIATNSNAPNTFSQVVMSDSIEILAWAQSRYDRNLFSTGNHADFLTDFFRSQDIWFAVYDLKKDSLIYKARMEDDTLTMISGRPEANPTATLISPEKSLITWQVDDP